VVGDSRWPGQYTGVDQRPQAPTLPISDFRFYFTCAKLIVDQDAIAQRESLVGMSDRDACRKGLFTVLRRQPPSRWGCMTRPIPVGIG
jgi:hypothetical protein